MLDNRKDTLKEVCFLEKLTGIAHAAFRPIVVSAKLAVVSGPIAALIISSLRVISITNPAAPAIVATVPVTATSGDNECIFVEGDTCYTLSSDSTNILNIVDLADINAPVILSSTAVNSAGSGFYRMAKLGIYLLIIRSNNVAHQTNTLEVINISNLAAPVSEAVYDLMNDFASPQLCADLLLDGNTAFISGDTGSPDFAACIGAYDLSALPAITQIAVTATDGPGTELNILDLQDHIAYCQILSVSNELRAYDVSNPAVPVLLGSLPISNNLIIFSQLSGGFIYGITLSTGDTNIYAFDWSTPATPTLLGQTLVTPTRNNFSIRASSTKVYLATRKGLTPRNRTVQIYNASAPAALVLQGQVLYTSQGGNTQLALLVR